MERYGAIDIGTNSTRLLIAGLQEGRVLPLYSALRITRLGEGMTRGEGLRPEAVRRTLKALAEYRQLLEEFGVGRVRVVATSAAREAADASAFIRQVREETGLMVEVIPGEEEAYLSYLGACRGLPGISSGMVMDIGGGSTEFTFCATGGERPVCRSVPMGAVRLTEQPLLLDRLLALYKPVLDGLSAIGADRLIGVGGTVTTLAAVDQGLVDYDRERVHGYRLTRPAVERILFHLAAKDSRERRAVPGLQPERADIIVAGTTILWMVLSYLGAAQITVSEADLLHGIILKFG